MKRILTLLMVCALLLGCVSGTALAAKSKQMSTDLPPWTEETVSQYALDYIEGKSMDRLWSYYDLQIRRYMPVESFSTFLLELEFMTGDFLGLGTYSSFEESSEKLKTHVLHLCMEKQDLDLYFTHKNTEKDWEIMAIEFVPAEKQQPRDAAMQVGTETKADYTETTVSIGTEPYVLEGVLTMPAAADAEHPVPACVLVHEFGALDRDMSIGKTKMFADVAAQFGEMGIATIRYDKRTYAYPEAPIETVCDEVIDDAISAIKVLMEQPGVDKDGIVVFGVGLGGMLAPRIASEANGMVDAIMIIGASPKSVLEEQYEREKNNLDSLTEAERAQLKKLIWNYDTMKEETSRQYEAFGRNGYYYWESARYSSVSLIRKLALPTYFGHARRDNIVIEDFDGAYTNWQTKVGINGRIFTYETFRGLNHLLMDDLTVGENGKSQFNIETHLDRQAGRKLANWILNLKTAKE